MTHAGECTLLCAGPVAASISLPSHTGCTCWVHTDPDAVSMWHSASGHSVRGDWPCLLRQLAPTIKHIPLFALVGTNSADVKAVSLTTRPRRTDRLWRAKLAVLRMPPAQGAKGQTQGRRFHVILPSPARLPLHTLPLAAVKPPWDSIPVTSCSKRGRAAEADRLAAAAGQGRHAPGAAAEAAAAAAAGRAGAGRHAGRIQSKRILFELKTEEIKHY